METIRFGRTGLMVSRTSFGGIPIQRLSDEDSTKILRKAYDEGINLFDTARIYTTSERKIGLALSDVRKDIIITSKTQSRNREGILADIDKSLSELKTDYIDVYQLHNPPSVPGEKDEMFETMKELKKAGKIRFIGFTNHDLSRAETAVKSGDYDTVQFPLSPISTENELALSKLCMEHDVGLLAMKALAGGLITNAVTSFVFLREYENIVPIWGMQHMWEIEEILGYAKNPPAKTPEIIAQMEKDRAELSGSFCRGCGYCLPCPAGIRITECARISLLLTRSDANIYMTDEWRNNMDKINNCIHCDNCKNHCPYSLDTPNLLKSQLLKYNEHWDKVKSGV